MTRGRILSSIFLCGVLLLAPSTVLGQAKGKKAPARATPTPAPEPAKVTASLGTVLDRRSAGKPFPGSLQIVLKLDGEDAETVKQVKAKVKTALDDSGQDLTQKESSGRQDQWVPRTLGRPLEANLELASPQRKATAVRELTGTVTLHLPLRDPSATVLIPDVLTRIDKPLDVPALTAQKVKLALVSKPALEKEKQAAKEKEKAKKAKEKKKKGEGMEEMFDAMGDAMTEMFERLFMTAGDNDLILKVSDPGKKVFSYDIAGPDGKLVESYGKLDLEGYTILRLFEPVPKGSSLRVNLVTPKAFAEVPFSFSGIKLP
ncbi:MAG: hypothetical protein IT186_19725 [Acidobacteria bacterium]|nr:hypothetical protein [Acidobacteriota bacterium]